MPAAPLVGAVTTRPPEAFSSLTASATRLTQSSANSGLRVGSSAFKRSYHTFARRRTRRPPGSNPSRAMLRCSHSTMTSRRCSSAARTSFSVRQHVSLRSAASLIDTSRRSQMSSSSWADT
ncbi:Uncharacterised protein [Mycobacterium tuberculosis]|nr:Uncharacterised protein [Mycobacterium tuberculosis]